MATPTQELSAAIQILKKECGDEIVNQKHFPTLLSIALQYVEAEGSVDDKDLSSSQPEAQ